MKLVTKKIKQAMPPIGATDDGSPIGDKMVHVKYFSPSTSWTWYGIEYDGSDCMFGLVHGFYPELGYFSIQELESTQVERDLYFEPCKLRDTPNCPKWARQ